MPKLKPSQQPLDRMITLRVNAETRDEWQARAKAHGLSLGDWLRVQVSSGTGVRALPRRKPPPSADPALLAAIGRIGSNLNQIARAANRQRWPGEIDLLHRLIDIERALGNLAPPHDD